MKTRVYLKCFVHDCRYHRIKFYKRRSIKPEPKRLFKKKKLVKLLYEEFLSLMNCQVNGKSSLMKGLAEKPYLNK